MTTASQLQFAELRRRGDVLALKYFRTVRQQVRSVRYRVCKLIKLPLLNLPKCRAIGGCKLDKSLEPLARRRQRYRRAAARRSDAGRGSAAAAPWLPPCTSRLLRRGWRKLAERWGPRPPLLAPALNRCPCASACCCCALAAGSRGLDRQLLCRPGRPFTRSSCQPICAQLMWK